ncbi:polysaccharide pyruvyl transferase family protein [Ruminiclostridium herbifermentans]|uniref:Polysaccharide pyruvyl transferase family protein n=1 Tax=Ruminiclostridium herbifermentans TaxID=2488810 RepID=A0A4U7JFY2_9FIRM|nr:polysaccharide pyruvyl transferase family protein [Ruminiclostridium herbifermentans]QNU66622.1 polysaccharide pyruvyl transferase family protein [Ruminiclostridium herbifermentans]
MTKVGILTFHRSINYGSFLQSYSLANALKSSTDFDVEIIDYNMTNVELYSLLSCFSYNISQTYKNVCRYFKFKRLLYKSLPISKDRIITNRLNIIEQQLRDKYDVIVVGSDEVWKINKLRGFPNIYWLSEKLKCIKVSYAASANRTRFDRLSNEQKKYIKDSLNQFAYIGVRDENTLKQLKNIDAKLLIRRNCDPAFLFEIENAKGVEAKLGQKLSKKYKLDLAKPIIAVMCTDEWVCKNIYEKYSKDYQIVSLYTNTKYCNAYLYDLDPFEWAHVFRFISLSVTNFFHCTVFSIINKTPFISIDVEEVSVLYESKIKDLLKRADLMENYFNLKHPSFQWDKVFEQIEHNINSNDTSKMEEFVSSEKKYFNEFVKELRNLSNKSLIELETKVEKN